MKLWGKTGEMGTAPACPARHSNTINLGADLGAMAAALHLLIDDPVIAYIGGPWNLRDANPRQSRGACRRAHIWGGATIGAVTPSPSTAWFSTI
jgi:hypothetical protein